jgi:hypothetical protein
MLDKANIEPANTTSPNDYALGDSDDLINFDDAAAVLNSPWGAPVSQQLRKSNHPPAPRAVQAKTTNLMDAPLGEWKSEHPQGHQSSQPMTGNLRGEAPAFQAGNAWAKPPSVAPNSSRRLLSGPAAVTPPTDLMQSVSLGQMPLQPRPLQSTPLIQTLLTSRPRNTTLSCCRSTNVPILVAGECPLSLLSPLA